MDGRFPRLFRARLFRAYLIGPALVIGFAACGQDETPEALPAIQPPGSGPSEAEPRTKTARERPAAAPDVPGRIGTPRDLTEAWHALAAEEDWRRNGAVTELLRGGVLIPELVHEAIREVRWGRDVGLLADLLSSHPWETLPVLLALIPKTALSKRILVLQALGRWRPRPEAARGVLLVRMLSGASPELRRAAAHALDAVVPPADPSEGWAQKRLPPLGMTPVTFDAIYGKDPNGRLVRALVTAAEFEAKRFGHEDADLLARLFDPLVVGPPRLLAMAKALLEGGGPAPAAVALLVEGGGPALDYVQGLLRAGRRLDVALPAVIGLGGRAALLAPDVLALRTDKVQRPRAFLVLKLLRPSGEVVDHFLRRLHDDDASSEDQAEALDILAWSAGWERKRVRAGIRSYVASRPSPGGVGEAAAEAALTLLGRKALWFGAETKRLVARTPWLAGGSMLAR